ncbi:hypothetical protein DNTS_016258 [Danionella cerebrum]|uniref:Uncharacterized protein n=1 Tax=Danionella cerebrum TaxID=2873325 RepID=A0A553Q0U4_9TELE|nr:hypothetical protein DNTS_016258 [Danionella translucida]
MQNGTSKTGRGVTANGTLKRKPKKASDRHSSTASCPVFSGSQSDLDEDPRCPSSNSSPSLHRPASASSLQGSLSNLKGSLTSLKSFPTSSELQKSDPCLQNSDSSPQNTTSGLQRSSPRLAKSSLKSSNSSLQKSNTSLWSSSSSLQNVNSTFNKSNLKCQSYNADLQSLDYLKKSNDSIQNSNPIFWSYKFSFKNSDPCLKKTISKQQNSKPPTQYPEESPRSRRFSLLISNFNLQSSKSNPNQHSYDTSLQDSNPSLHSSNSSLRNSDSNLRKSNPSLQGSNSNIQSNRFIDKNSNTSFRNFKSSNVNPRHLESSLQSWNPCLRNSIPSLKDSKPILQISDTNLQDPKYNLQNSDPNLRSSKINLKNSNPKLKNSNIKIQSSHSSLKTSDPCIQSFSYSLRNSSPQSSKAALQNSDVKNSKLNIGNSNPNLQNSTPNLQDSDRSLQRSNPSLKDSDENLNNSNPQTRTLKTSLQTSNSSLQNLDINPQNTTSSLQNSTSSLQSSSSSLRSSSPSLRGSSFSSSEDESWDTNSWSSGATCLLRSSIKQHSEEFFRACLDTTDPPEATSDSENTCQISESEIQEQTEPTGLELRDSESSIDSTGSSDLENKIEEKLKFSQFLDEVTSRVLHPECLEAFGVTGRLKDSPTHSPNPSPASSPQFGPRRDSLSDSRESNTPVFMSKWAKCMPTCKILDPSESQRKRNQEGPTFLDGFEQSYLETDIDRVRREDATIFAFSRDVDKRSLKHFATSRRGFKCIDAVPDPQNQSSALQRSPLSRKRSEFESTQRFLENELRHASDELDAQTEKLHRMQSSHAVLQRINQDLEQNILRMTQRHEEEKRSLNRQIHTLNSRLTDAHGIIQKLRRDNELYRKDCNLAAQLLQCGKTPHRTHTISELPVDLQKHLSSLMQNPANADAFTRSVAPHQSHSNVVPIRRIHERPDPGRSCPVSRSPSPDLPQFPENRRLANKSSDLYFSDTVLYCQPDERRKERWPERRQSEQIDRDAPNEFPLRSGYYSNISSEENLSATTIEHKHYPSMYAIRNPDTPKTNPFKNGVSSENVYSALAFNSNADDLRSVRSMDDWRSMDDISMSQHMSFSECNVAKIKLNPHYGGIQDRDNFTHGVNSQFNIPSSPAMITNVNQNKSKSAKEATFFSKDSPHESTRSLIASGTNDILHKDMATEKFCSLAESINIPKPISESHKCHSQVQRFKNTGLSRKDSLNRAQLYGTLLN